MIRHYFLMALLCWSALTLLGARQEHGQVWVAAELLLFADFVLMSAL